ncbi:MAG: hypothetical protein R3C03_22475 [Pirellulaceae bacterium]
MRSLVCIALVLGSVFATGCVGPMGMGPGCGLNCDSCYDCEGGYGTRQPIATGPIDALRNAKRSLVCGGGCGEVYYGEWVNSPPDCSDPCCGNQFVGGAVPCTPFCWQPGALLGNLYGHRFDSCDSGGCDDCGCGGEYVTESQGALGGCSTCAAKRQKAGGAMYAAAKPVANPTATRQTTTRTANAAPSMQRRR